MPSSETAEKTIIIRDRRKPNQYTTDNIVAREWLPILRVGDAFYFYSIFLSMSNRETESSWSSLRTMAQYLQCGIDLIIRANRLLEICELIYIETGSQHASNEYYILDPPTLTPELKERICRRLEDIEGQETSKNWQAWVKQVRKAMDKHRSLPSIWAERRARRGGRPPKTLRPQNPDREPRAGFPGEGACESQPGYLWLTSTEIVTHDQGVRGSQAKQEQETRVKEQGEEKDPEDLVRKGCLAVGVAQPTIDVMLENYPVERIARQLDWLPGRQARDPAAMLVSAVQGDWSQPALYDADQARAVWKTWRSRSNGAAGENIELDGIGASAVGTREAIILPGTDLDAQEIWAHVLDELRMQMTRATFDTWLGGSQVVGVEGEGMVVLVRDAYAEEWLRARWLHPIQRTLRGIVGRAVPVRFERR